MNRKYKEQLRQKRLRALFRQRRMDNKIRTIANFCRTNAALMFRERTLRRHERWLTAHVSMQEGTCSTVHPYVTFCRKDNEIRLVPFVYAPNNLGLYHLPDWVKFPVRHIHWWFRDTIWLPVPPTEGQ